MRVAASLSIPRPRLRGVAQCAMARWLMAALVLALTLLAPASAAQAFAFRIAPGLAYAEDFGWSGLVAFEMRWTVLVARVDAHLVYVPNSVAEAAYAGAALGAAPVVRSTALRPYFLVTVSRGVDIREADGLTTLGLAGGVDLLAAHVFGELRYENSLQHAHPSYYTLPEHQVTLCVGLRLGRL